jgi:hypothetical protein
VNKRVKVNLPAAFKTLFIMDFTEGVTKKFPEP